MDSDQEPIDGCYDPSTGSIYLAKMASVEAMEETLLHEILHGVSDATASKLDEDTVYRLSRALYGAGVRPPKLLRKRDKLNDLSQ